MNPDEQQAIADEVENAILDLLVQGLRDHAALFAESDRNNIAAVLRQVADRFDSRR